MKIRLAVALFAAACATRRAPLPVPDRIAAVDHYLDAMRDSGFAGAVVIAERGRIALAKGYGLADRAHAVPATPRTLFHLGSVTKQFTAAAILRLEMEGRLDVRDPITRFFRDVPADKQQITIHQLLTHTAGLSSQAGGCSSDDTLSRDAQVQRVLATPLASTPGAIHRYSNSGYSLLGAIVELASGQPYEDYLREHLFRAAGMLSTGYSIAFSDSTRVARGYDEEREFRGIVNAWERSGPVWCVRASGGLLSSAEDMYRWHVALRGTKVLSAAAKGKFFTPYVKEEPEGTSYYAYGWAVSTTRRGTKVIAHNGALGEHDHFAADFRWYVDEDVFYFIAGNSAQYTALTASSGVGRILFY